MLNSIPEAAILSLLVHMLSCAWWERSVHFCLVPCSECCQCIELSNHGAVSRGLPVNGSTEHKLLLLSSLMNKFLSLGCQLETYPWPRPINRGSSGCNLDFAIFNTCQGNIISSKGQSVMINLHQIRVPESFTKSANTIVSPMLQQHVEHLSSNSTSAASVTQLTRPDLPLVQQQHQARRPDNRLHTGCPRQAAASLTQSLRPSRSFHVFHTTDNSQAAPLWQQQQSRSPHRG